MDRKIYNILTLINENGYEAYVIGGYVRDYLLGKKTTDIDITTSAKPEELSKFLDGDISDNRYGSFKINIDEYNIEITTFRKDIYSNNRYPQIEYLNSLKEDIIRRDFTINTIAMDKDLNIIDYLNGQEDLNNKLIKSVGDPNIKFIEDPLRILRTIRFATTLDFEIEINTLNAIKNNIKELSKLSNKKIKDEVDKILSSTNSNKGITLIKELGIDKIVLKNN